MINDRIITAQKQNAGTSVGREIMFLQSIFFALI